jgi:H+/Cl- antiporter ClcA
LPARPFGDSKNLSNNRIDRRLGDFTTEPRVLVICVVAFIVGVAALLGGVMLLALIRLCTNIAYLGTWSFANLNLGDHQLGPSSVLVPVVGALIIGLMARYGSDKIRGHGIPEAIGRSCWAARSSASRWRSSSRSRRRSRSAPAGRSAPRGPSS